MNVPEIQTQRNNAVLTVTLSRPQALNSLTSAMIEALITTLEEAAQDSSVRCVVLTGSGRAFCAGQDLTDPMVAVDPAPGAALKDLGVLIERWYNRLVLLLRRMPVPVIAAVNGVAAGAGASIALNCDLVVAARNASFIMAFSKIALVPDTGATWLLPRLVGRANALGLALLGDKLSASEAQQMGLIWRAEPEETFESSVQALAQRLCAMPLRALVATRELIDGAMLQTIDKALEAELTTQRRLGASADYLEGVSAFVAKRAPLFKER